MNTTQQHKTGTREEWRAARLQLLKEEKELTRRSDELAQKRQELPWVPIERNINSIQRRGKPPWPDFLKAGRS